MHLTMRARAGLRSLRHGSVFPAVRAAIGAAEKGTFRVVHFSVQSDHVHLIVEASDKRALSSGVRGLAIRIAMAVNRALNRQGPVWGDRYHTRVLPTPLEVRRGLVYVLMNFRKHGHAGGPAIDPCSSAAWFDGFRTREGRPRPPDDAPSPTSRPRTWLATTGWRRRGLIHLHERPAAAEVPPGRSVEHPRDARARKGGPPSRQIPHAGWLSSPHPVSLRSPDLSPLRGAR